MSASTGYRLVKLANGLFSVRSLAEHETFHPVVGPAAEADTLYVEQLDLKNRLRTSREHFVVWDVGLGAAANAVAVLRNSERIQCTLSIHSFDKTVEALRFALGHAAQLGYFGDYEPVARELLEQGCVTVSDGSRIAQWQLHLVDFPDFVTRPDTAVHIRPNAVLYDPFSPKNNPEMWTFNVFKSLFEVLDPGRPCALATYSRSTMLRVTLLLAGFYVGKGTPTGTKEETTIAANTLDLIRQPLDRRWLSRALRSTSAEPLTAPVYRQAPLSRTTCERLLAHPQFR
ncbi:MAG: MnmC family methyltransferase [Verrucomicrobiae bacterium]|nr:MnmC family methyltransferase [Verrucomicrobiae bacterium]